MTQLRKIFVDMLGAPPGRFCMTYCNADSEIHDALLTSCCMTHFNEILVEVLDVSSTIYSTTGGHEV